MKFIRFCKEKAESKVIRSCRCSSTWVCTRALLAVNARFIEGESLFAFLDDLYVLCSPERVSDHEIPGSEQGMKVLGAPMGWP